MSKIIYKLDIEKVKGDIFQFIPTNHDSPVHLLCNATNSIGVMGAGIAAAFAKKFPDMFEDYKNACKSGLHGIGVTHFYSPDNLTNICNICTMTYPGTKVTEQDIRLTLGGFFNDIIYSVSSKKEIVIVMPYLGCGIGGFSKEKFEEILETWEFHEIEPNFKILLVDY